ncbi:MAG TPA: dihydrolipoamide acetyltransferase family protein [Bacteroidales bacterium]|jgi:2-oxoglutarate dehydrogenase E2 component (dihydrolipoamide succinyltransferase)|nr:diapophytoene dehydrogenase [Bacteroidota bacterium]HJN05237.1 dihydrolipoamide acetyltransferase family protein [Bacteroidales bacterium]|tara:strand:+ start:1797 stop:3095 length:1299 start_codon:yes stop_codon:yes gene_type:complete
MAKFEIIMPKLGESIIEATITKWVKNVGDQLEEDDSIVEIATDKVDSEIPSPVEGQLSELLFKEGDVVAVGTVIAIVDIDGDEAESEITSTKDSDKDVITKVNYKNNVNSKDEKKIDKKSIKSDYSNSSRFYSPLVKSIAAAEKIDISELDNIKGSGKEGRVTKKDVQEYLNSKGSSSRSDSTTVGKGPSTPISSMVGDKVVEMDRMRRLIADHMVMSKQVSPHVTSFIDVDVTNIVEWRNKVKDSFQKREGEKITFTPIFLSASSQALRDYPQINVSLDGYNIVYRKEINVGMATALPNGNLIVPVVKNADQKSLLGIVKSVNDLASRARANKLQPDEIQGGTFTITNFGSFDSLTGTPIINQPQVAILGIGAIRKQPAVIETNKGDFIGIKHIMILSLAYDHRIVDGALAGMYLKRLKELLENFSLDTII